MKQGAHAFAWIAGICAGILNLLCGLNALGNMLLALEYVAVPIGLILAGGALIAVTGLSLTGGCLCRTRRIAGGVVMLVSAVLLLLIGAVCVYVPLHMPGVFLDAFGVEYGEGVSRAVLGAGLLLLFSNLLSTAAAVVSFTVKPRQMA